MRLKDVMSTRVKTIERHEPLARAQNVMNLQHIHHLVVVDGPQVVGLVTDEALVRGEAEGIARVEDVMCRHLVSASPEMTVRQTATLMRGRTVGALPVFEHQRLVGVVTVSDLLDLLGKGVVRPLEASRCGTVRRPGAKRGTSLAVTRRAG